MHSNLVIREQKSRSWYIGIGLASLLLFVTTFLVGRFLAVSDLAETKQNLQQLELKLKQTLGALDNVSESLVMQKQSAQVDDLSNQELVNSVKIMQQTNSELQQELSFYRKIMAPALDQDGLTVDSVQILATNKVQVFQIQTTLIQAGKQLQYLKGSAIIKFQGEMDGLVKEFDIRELGTFKAKHFQFQFKYFQNIQGFVELPDGFTVKSLTVTAKTRGLRKNQTAKKQIKWQPEESQQHVR
ncbi:MAG: hypothetical protein KUG78_10610 [Kangiellaceae bacterium]|nr:hypothetical protein [Kangiellaceae bacterium]